MARPLAAQWTLPEVELNSDVQLVGVHFRTAIFIFAAFLVGFGLLLAMPKLSVSHTNAPESVVTGEAAVSGQTGANAPEEVLAPSGADAAAAPEHVANLDAMSTSISPLFTPEVQYWAPKIREWSQTYQLDPDIIATIMQIESCGNPAATSHAGAQGLFQVMPFHFEPGENMLDPENNARRGLEFYKRQLEYTGFNIYLSFAGYNGGYAASGSGWQSWAGETQRYYTWAKGIYDEVKSGAQQSPTLQSWLDAGGAGGCQIAARQLGL